MRKTITIFTTLNYNFFSKQDFFKESVIRVRKILFTLLMAMFIFTSNNNSAKAWGWTDEQLSCMKRSFVLGNTAAYAAGGALIGAIYASVTTSLYDTSYSVSELALSGAKYGTFTSIGLLVTLISSGLFYGSYPIAQEIFNVTLFFGLPGLYSIWWRCNSDSEL